MWKEYSDGYERGYQMGVAEGFMKGSIKLLIHILNKNPQKDVVKDKTFTEFERQQALFYIRIGIEDEYSVF
ncbi:MAG: hypothetical protein ACI4HI_18240 [Lachnospiraceae bacterium]